ncbi:MAG: hypothetical protein U0136_20425 [Bdellovibrionota bacterium]
MRGRSRASIGDGQGASSSSRRVTERKKNPDDDKHRRHPGTVTTALGELRQQQVELLPSVY